MSYEFSEAECKKWVRDRKPPVNPRTKRSIDPNAEFGVYKELERQCVQNGIVKKTKTKKKDKEKEKDVEIDTHTRTRNAVQKQKTENEGMPQKNIRGKSPSLCSLCSSASHLTQPGPVTGHIIIVRKYVNPVLENVMRCMRQHCDTRGKKAADEMADLEEKNGIWVQRNRNIQRIGRSCEEDK